MQTYPKLKNKKQEVIEVEGGEGLEDEEGWDDCDSDEDFYNTEEQTAGMHY